jgi:hypothetical protein
MPGSASRGNGAPSRGKEGRGAPALGGGGAALYGAPAADPALPNPSAPGSGVAMSSSVVASSTSGRLWLRVKVSAARGRKLEGLRTNWEVLPSANRTRRPGRPSSSAGSSPSTVCEEGAAPPDSGAGSVGLAGNPSGSDPARESLGAGPPPSAATGAGESPLLESVASWGSDAAPAGLPWPAADGAVGCGLARSSVSPIPNGCPNTAGRLSADPEKGARRFENVTVVM